jgi:large subunit ribosomal protein L15
MPLVRRVPKRGFTNLFRREFAAVNVERLSAFEANEQVTPETLVERGVLRPAEVVRVKLLAQGEIDRPLQISVHAASDAAKAKVEAAGGTVQILGG